MRTAMLTKMKRIVVAGTWQKRSIERNPSSQRYHTLVVPKTFILTTRSVSIIPMEMIMRIDFMIRTHFTHNPAEHHYEVTCTHEAFDQRLTNASTDVIISAIAPSDVPFQKILIDAAIAALSDISFYASLATTRRAWV